MPPSYPGCYTVLAISVVASSMNNKRLLVAAFHAASTPSYADAMKL
jgi:hypothetical protein